MTLTSLIEDKPNLHRRSIQSAYPLVAQAFHEVSAFQASRTLRSTPTHTLPSCRWVTVWQRTVPKQTVPETEKPDPYHPCMYGIFTHIMFKGSLVEKLPSYGDLKMQ